MRKMMMSAVALALSFVPAVAGAWETHDVIDNFADVVGQLTATHGTMSGTHGDVAAAFVVRQMKGDGKTTTCSVYLVAGGSSYFTGDRLKAQYRVDKGDKIAIDVVPSVDNKALFLEGAAVTPLLRQLVKGEELRVVVQQRTGGEAGFTFKAEGLREAVTPIVKACGVDLDAPTPAKKPVS